MGLALPPYAGPLPDLPCRGKVLPALPALPAPVVSPHSCSPTFGAPCSRRDLGHPPPFSEQGAALQPGFAAGAQAVSRGQARVGSADRQPVGRALPVWGWDTPAASLGHPGSQLLLL